MEQATLTALQDSIEHWKRLESGKRRKGECLGADDCALCGVFNNWNTPIGDECLGCPVFEKTGERRCEKSPYNSARNIYVEHGKLDSPEFKAAAKEERLFLESLLPGESDGHTKTG